MIRRDAIGLAGAALGAAFLVRAFGAGHVDGVGWALALGGAAGLLVWAAGGDDARDADADGLPVLLVLVAGGVVTAGLDAVAPVWDVARADTARLAPATVDLLDRVDGDVTLVAVFRHGSATQRAMARRLAPWQAAGPVTVRWLDPLRAPAEAAALGVTREEGELWWRTDGRDPVRIVGRMDESALAAGLVRLLADRERRACWPQLDGAPDPDEVDLPDGVGRAVLAVESLDWRVVPTPPDVDPRASACDALWIVDPRTAPAPETASAWAAWVRDGGALVLWAEPGRTDAADAVAAPLGVRLPGGLVVDDDPASSRLGAAEPALLVLDGDRHRGDADLAKLLDGPAVFAVATPVTSKDGRGVWLRAGPSASVETLDGARTPFADGALAVARDAGAGRVVVIGDVSFGSNRALALGAHRQLVLDGLGWAARATTGLGARPAGRHQTLAVTADDGSRLRTWALVGLPGLALAMAAGLAVRRRGA